ncbi:MAG TPA: peptidoglycan-binding protein [Ktedonobacteraceae bacterium]|nr:peptidoglycan-binding protein [Ktedonobacteraceae bacterium]
MLQTQSPVDKPKKMRWFLPLLSGLLVVAVLVGALLISFTARGGAHAAAASFTRAQIINIIHNAFGTGTLGNQAISVATCESSLNPNAFNPAPPFAMGLFQIAKGTWAEAGIGKGNPFNPTDNAQAARRLYNRQGWAPWACQPSSLCPAMIQNGSTGSLVVSLQSELDSLYSKKAFPNSPFNFHPLLAKDGQFGTLTANAVKDFQKQKRLAVDGVVGPNTWHALGRC